MNLAVKTSLGILLSLLLLTLIKAEPNKIPENFDQLCQALKCNPRTEICQTYSNCQGITPSNASKCVVCNPKEAKRTLLAASISQHPAPLAPRLLAKSSSSRLLADNRGELSNPNNNGSLSKSTVNQTVDHMNYDDYYEYDEDETSDKNNLGEEDDYLDDYTESIDKIIQGSDPIRKPGVCPRVVRTDGDCDPLLLSRSDCRFDTDCPTDEKCCEAGCAKRLCTKSIPAIVSVCPTSFTCSLNCRLGYRTDSNGCLLCECQTCPSMDQCQKNCPAGYLKDLFGCNICECIDPCPTLDCNITCPSNVGFVKSKDGCPLCQCATASPSVVIDRTSSCQDDVHCPPGFRCLNDAQNVPMCQAAVDPNVQPIESQRCPDNLLEGCTIQCPDNNYALDYAGCPVCACVPKNAPSRFECPMFKCRANCGSAGYQIDENGCQTCNCATAEIVKPAKVECSRVMCRMFCVHGFRRDENGCEICRCNDSPQPCPDVNCESSCPNGYRKDYSGCQTCTCEEEKASQNIVQDGCTPMICTSACKYGYERDPSGCPLCSCNRCPVSMCRMFCMYGFNKNSDGCELCECNWSPVEEKIACSERIPCTGTRVCNANLKLCETVSADRVNWFVYRFNVDTALFQDRDFTELFKRSLVNNIASKYDFEVGQVTVSHIENDGTVSFQIMPYYAENVDDFQRKIDQVDLDLNSNEFQNVIPSVTSMINKKPSQATWAIPLKKYFSGSFLLVAGFLGLIGIIAAGILVSVFCRNNRFPHRSDSKLPIYETSYHQAPTEDDHYHAVHAPDGTAYVVVESDEANPSNEKRVIV